MSAPDTNVHTQSRQHRAPLWGIFGGLAIVAALFVAFLAYTAYQGGTPVTPAEQTRWGTGDPVVSQPAEVTPQKDANPALPTATSGVENDRLTPMQNDAMTDSQTMSPGASPSIMPADPSGSGDTTRANN